MWKDLWQIITQRETLLDDAHAETLDMLDRAQEMFDVVVSAMVEEVGEDVLKRIAAMDKKLNDEMRDIRTKVFEHLAVSKGRDLLMGLVLTSVVIDLERIGDYTKNIGELVTWIPGRLDFGDYEERWESIVARTREMFDRTRNAFRKEDVSAAIENVEFYAGISRDADGILKEIIETGAPSETIEKRILGLAMLLRYLKRTAAHLKNVCTTVSNPFPDFGFRPDGGGDVE